MEVFGYSERGIIDALFYSIYFSKGTNLTSNLLLKNLLEKTRMPLIGDREWGNILEGFDDYEVYIENTMSEFGDPDVVILCKKEGNYAGCIFIEAKVSKSGAVLKGEFNRFVTEVVKPKGAARAGTSSLLFSQLSLKWLSINKAVKGFVDNSSMGKLLALNLSPPKSGRKIGSNNIATDLFNKIKTIDSDDIYFVALVPDRGAILNSHFKTAILPELSALLGNSQVSRWGYLTWQDVEHFCNKSNFTHCMAMFNYNKGHIY